MALLPEIHVNFDQLTFERAYQIFLAGGESLTCLDALGCRSPLGFGSPKGAGFDSGGR